MRMRSIVTYVSIAVSSVQLLVLVLHFW